MIVYILVIKLSVISSDLHWVAVDLLDMRIDSLSNCMADQMADAAAVFLADTLDRIIFCINNCVVSAYLWQECCNSFAESSLGIFTDKYSYRGILVDNFQHTMEEFCTVDRLCT